ncbi:MAG: hypothetical protein IJ634_06625 [Bacteroidales bacterium]|nr:hypothetical protein [Bacteroidales bacterium]
MKKIAILIVVFHVSFFNFLGAQTAVGQWRSCLDYSQVSHLAYAGDRVYAGANSGVFCYHIGSRTMTPMSKGDGLNDVGIATLAYDAATQCLVVAYNNSNVDIVSEGIAYNLSDIKRSEIMGDKSIYHIRFANGNAYLATGFGVVVLDLRRMEIRETWYMGAGGSYTPVYDLAFMADSLYAATGEGLKRLSSSERHPNISDRWETDPRLDGLTVNHLCVAGSHLLVGGYGVNPNESHLYRLAPTGYEWVRNGNLVSMQTEGNRLAVCIDGNVIVYDTAMSFLGIRDSYTWGALSANDAVVGSDGTLWVGHPWEGLVACYAEGGDDTFRPAGPVNNDHVYRLKPFNYRMMLCPGGHTPTYASSYLNPDLITSTGLQWQLLDQSNGLLGGMSDIVDAAVNPLDTNETVAALWGHGVASIRGNSVQTVYTADNTDGALVPYSMGTYSRLNSGAVAFDRQGTLWVLVSNSTHALACRQPNGTWKGFSTQQLGSGLEVDKLVWDSINGYLWFLGRSNVIYVHDGKERMARVNPNNGSKLETSMVTALAQDQNGNLWLGTDKGIKVIYDGYRAFNNGGNGEQAPVSCSNITITNGEFAEYLMAYESITAIAVDGANRKWVGTANGGLYLLSANGLDQLEHFTTANSPLYSDKIITLGINERTGEVFIGTDHGLQVYRGTATYAVSQPIDDVHAFPNPVRPDYDGPIAIKGFARNSIVHITDAAGHTVFSTTANGGQAIWNGRTLEGEKVASGVYYIFASDDQGDNRAVGKVLIIR